MMTLIEEMRAAVLELWQALGFEGSSRTAAAVVPALVLGIALNVVALNVVNGAGSGSHASCRKVGLRNVVQTEFVMVRAAATATLAKLCEGQRRLCSAKQWVQDRQADAARFRSEASCGWVAQVNAKGVALRIRMELPELGHCRQTAENVA